MTNPKTCAVCGRREQLRRGRCRRCDMSARARIGYQCSFVDAEPARQHIAALNAAGVGSRRIHELSGVSRSGIRAITIGQAWRGHPPRHRISENTANAILAVEIPHAYDDAATAEGHHVSAVGTRRRLQALVAAGHTRTALFTRIGILPSNGAKLLKPDCARVTAATARTVAALFDELQLVPGTSQRARNEGQRHGWPMPLQWDETAIDDPTAQPCRDDGPSAGFVERYLEMRDLGRDDHEIAESFRIKPESLDRQLFRHGIKGGAA